MRKTCIFVFAASLLGFGVTHLAHADQLPGTQSAPQEAKIADQINTRFHADTDLKNNRIQVTVYNHVVTLKGVVDSDGERDRAARLAMVGGVTQVDNQLKVGSEGTNAIPDATITARLKTEFLAEDALRSVHVVTNNKVVTLTGIVATEAAHARALELARSMSGVSRVEDDIRIASAQPPMPH